MSYLILCFLMLIFVRMQRVLLKMEITRAGLQRDRREGRSDDSEEREKGDEL